MGLLQKSLGQARDDMRIERARAEDIQAIARLFTDSFRDSVLHHCGGRLPKPQAMEDVFTLVYEAEPPAALVARNEQNQLVGYCFAPVGLSKLWCKAVTGGYLCRWLWHWLSGRYGFGLYPLKVIVMNKLAFLSSAVTPAKTANARILSIAVAAGYRGQGIAFNLMTEAMNYFMQHKIPRIRLEVRPDNVYAIRLYEKLGFVPAGYTSDSQGRWLIMFCEMGER